jgi:hypothetical protein
LLELRNQRVRFKILNVYHPDPTKVLIDLHGDNLLTGTVVDLTESGMPQDAFVVVEVEGVGEPVIVPVALTSVYCERLSRQDGNKAADTL